MKKVLFLGLMLVGILIIVSCAPREGSLVGEASKIGGQSNNNQKINIDLKNVQKIVQDNPKIRNMVLKLGTFDPKLITRVAEDIEICSATPSCSSPNYEVTATNCTTWRSIESCYVCSVKEEIKSRAICPEGWGDPADIRYSWTSNAFNCYSNCFQECDIGLGEEIDTECASSCPLPTSLEQPCPEGFTFYDWSADSDPNGFAYACLLPSVSDIYYPVCNQCGSDFLFDTGSGDIRCDIRS